jgi:hypothetical protein
MTAAIVIECEFETKGFPTDGGIYTCELRVDPSITSPGVTVTSATGSHKPSMSHADVQGFYSLFNTINFMPRGLNDVFPNLIGIAIDNAGIKEIHQSDMKQFPRLKDLCLFGNAITVVGQDLFKFNTELEYISLDDNKITQIHPTVFDHLNKLSYLWLLSNVCINDNAHDRSAVKNMIISVKQKCPGDFTQIEVEDSSKSEP